MSLNRSLWAPKNLKVFATSVAVLVSFLVGIVPSYSCAQTRPVANFDEVGMGDYIRFKADRKWVVGRVHMVDEESQSYYCQTVSKSKKFARAACRFKQGEVKIVWSKQQTVLFDRNRVRKWYSNSSKRSIEAEFVELDGLEAVLKKTDGATVRVPVRKLAIRSRKFFEDLKQQDAGKIVVSSEIPKSVLAFVEIDIETAEQFKKEVPFQFTTINSWTPMKGLKFADKPFSAGAFDFAVPSDAIKKRFRIYLPNHLPVIESSCFNQRYTAVAFYGRSLPTKRESVLGVCHFDQKKLVVSTEKLKKFEKAIAISPSGRTVLTEFFGPKGSYFISIWKEDGSALKRSQICLMDGKFHDRARSPLKLLSDSLLCSFLTASDRLFFLRLESGKIFPIGFAKNLRIGDRFGDSYVINKSGDVAFFFSSKNVELCAINLKTMEAVGVAKLPVPSVDPAKAPSQGFLYSPRLWISPKHSQLVIHQNGNVSCMKYKNDGGDYRFESLWSIGGAPLKEQYVPYSHNTVLRVKSGRILSGPHSGAIAKWSSIRSVIPWFGFIRLRVPLTLRSGNYESITLPGSQGTSGKPAEIVFGRLETNTVESIVGATTIGQLQKYGRGEKVRLEFDLGNIPPGDLVAIRRGVADKLRGQGILIDKDSRYALKIRRKQEPPRQVSITVSSGEKNEERRTEKISVRFQDYELTLNLDNETIHRSRKGFTLPRFVSSKNLAKLIKDHEKVTMKRINELSFPEDQATVPTKQLKKLPVMYLK